MKIRILPDDIANRIAAGEVVERPASVVKELVENALDAGARKITVDVEEGGRKRIQVTDDGEGMTPEDARACFGRHATSKLYEPDDLFAIKTLGFRGEALPSIASVSHLVLETQAEASAGTVIEIAGGRVVSEREQAFPRGTQITVDDLFFNVPARRKFLRSESYELSQITTYCTHYALAFPEIHFVLRSAGFEILAAPVTTGFRDRIFQIFGKDLLDQLVEYQKDYGRSGVKVHLFTSRPHVQKYNRNSMFFFINRRLVRDKIILHAISEAYRNILPAGTFPVVILFVSIPYEDVDVNVHPAKTEVRFKHQSFVHDAIRDAILSGLTQDKTIVPMESDGVPTSPFTAPAPQPRIPDSWASDDPIARESFALEPGMRTVMDQAIPLDLNFRASETKTDGCDAPAGPKTIAIKTAPAMLKASAVEKLLVELLDGLERETQVINIEALKKKIAATVSCHAAIKINTPLEETKMRWLITELMKTDVPTVCPHGRPIILRYDLREIQKAFKRA